MEDQKKVTRFDIDFTGMAPTQRAVKAAPPSGQYEVKVIGVNLYEKAEKRSIVVNMIALNTPLGNCELSEWFNVPKGVSYFWGMIDALRKPDGSKFDTAKFSSGKVTLDWDKVLKNATGWIDYQAASETEKYARVRFLPAEQGASLKAMKVSKAAQASSERTVVADDAPRQTPPPAPAPAVRPAPAPAPAPAPEQDISEDDIPF